MSEIKWLPEALAHIERLYAFLKDKNPDAAKRAAGAIRDGARLLSDGNPLMGRPMQDDSQRREWFIAFGGGAYVLRYRMEGDAIVIIRVWHSREGRGI